MKMSVQICVLAVACLLLGACRATTGGSSVKDETATANTQGSAQMADGGAPTSAPGQMTDPGALPPMKAADFTTFMGLTYGNGLDDAVAIFGQPSKVITLSPQLVSYRYDMLNPSTQQELPYLMIQARPSDKIISKIGVYTYMTSLSAIETQPGMNGDPRINSLIGASRDAVQAAFGGGGFSTNPEDPDRVFAYDAHVPDKNILIQFNCSNGPVTCYDLAVYWNYPFGLPIVP